MVVFEYEVTNILHNILFIFHFVLPILPRKRKTWYRKSLNKSDEKPKMKLPKYVMSRAYITVQSPATQGQNKFAILKSSHLFFDKIRIIHLIQVTFSEKGTKITSQAHIRKFEIHSKVQFSL